MQAVTVVIPAHNEVDNIATLLQETCAVLRGNVVFEIVCVDDGSRDGTDTVLAQLKASMPELRAYRHEHCAGQSVALLTGVRRARHAWIATMDGDGQNDPADIPKLIARLTQASAAVKLVAGWRVQRNDGAGKRWSSRLANRIRRYFLKDGTPDTGCGIKLFERDTFLALPSFNHMHRYLPALVQRAGFETVSEPVNHRPRTAGRSKYTNLGRAWVGMRDLLGVAWLIQRPTRAHVRDL